MELFYFTLVIISVILIQNSILVVPCFAAPTIDNEIRNSNDKIVESFRKNTALRMKSYMNTSVDPCDDFYEFACGNFPNAIEQIETLQKRSTFSDIQFNLNDLIEVILQKHRQPDEKFSGELRKAKQLFDSCMDENLWPIQQKEEFLEVLKAIGGFPAIDPSWNASVFDWFNMTAHLSRYGVDGLVTEAIELRPPYPPYYMGSQLGFGFDAYLENIATKEDPGYLYNAKVMKELLDAYGVADSKADEVIEKVMEFWREVLLVEQSEDFHEFCDYLSYDTEFPKWNSFFDIAWEGPKFVSFEESECPCDWYYNKLDTIIAKRPEATANYMALKFLFSMHPQPQVKSSKFQRTHCLTFVRENIPFVLSYFYMKEHYSKSAEDDINEMISEIKLSMQNIVKSADWLDDPTRHEALEKIRLLRTWVGEVSHPSTEVYIKEINNLNLTDNFAENILKISKFNVDLSHYSYLHSDMPEKILPIELLTGLNINAFYLNLNNSINVMAGILHPPVYHPYFPKSLNYGSLGYVIGHELAHGFDNFGSMIDSNLTEKNWWTEKSGKLFQERVKCFVQHYGQYTVPEINRKLNGTIVQDENIADSGGLREALAAYRRVFKTAVKNKVQDFERNESLPELDMTPEQTFFLSFAQTYCAKYDLHHFWNEISDAHPLNKYRVLGSLQNFSDFPLVFNCSLGSPMNPKEKCRLF